MIPLPTSNPAAGLIEDTLLHYGISRAEAARAMAIPPSRLCDIIKGRKGVSADTALRFEQCFKISSEWLMKVQASYDYSKAFHTKAAKIRKEVISLVPS